MIIEPNIYYDDKSGLYRVKIIRNGKTYATTSTTLEHAQNYKQRFLLDIQRDKRCNLQTVQEYTSEFLTEKAKEKLADRTMQNYIHCLTEMCKQIGERNLKDISEFEWRDIFIDFYNNHTFVNNTFNKYVDAVRALCLYFSIPFNSRRYKKPRIKSHRRNFNKEEMRIFLETAKEVETLNFYTLFALYFNIGARRNELLALTWEDIDFRFSRLTINKALSEQKGGVKIVPTKDKQTRTISMGSQKIMNYLHQLYEQRRPGQKYVFINDTVCSRGAVQQNEFLGGKTVARHFKRILKIAGLDENLSIHSCRHTMATMALSNGHKIKDVQAVGGWANSSTLINIYDHPLEEGIKSITAADDMF